MNGILELALWFFLLWVGSVAIAYTWTRLTKAKRQSSQPSVRPGSSWKLLARSGVYRVRFIETSELGYIVSAPLQGDSYVPLRPGDSVHVDAGCDEKVIRFRTAVMKRNDDDHTLLLAIPANFKEEERRSARRQQYDQGWFSRLNGEPAVLLDLGEGGARIRTQACVQTGDWVTLALPEKDDQYACVLEVQPDSLNGRPASAVRVIFAEPT